MAREQCGTYQETQNVCKNHQPKLFPFANIIYTGMRFIIVFVLTCVLTFGRFIGKDDYYLLSIVVVSLIIIQYWVFILLPSARGIYYLFSFVLRIPCYCPLLDRGRDRDSGLPPYGPDIL